MKAQLTGGISVLPCSCKHTYQDSVYGAGKRVHNFARKSNSGNGGWRCTVCKAVKAKSESKAAPVEDKKVAAKAVKSTPKKAEGKGFKR